jgi:hypothetical protein
MVLTLWLSTDYHHGPRKRVRVPPFPEPGEAVRHPPQQDNPTPPRSQWPCRTPAPDIEGSHHVPHTRTVDSGPTIGPPRVTNRIQRRPAVITAGLVYGEPLRVPGEFLVPAAPKVEPSIFIQQLHRFIDHLRPTPAARHASPTTFIHKDLKDSTHVFLRQDTIRRALEPPYSGPHKAIARTDKTLNIVVRGRQVTVSADRVKPAYILEAPHHGTGSPPA